MLENKQNDWSVMLGLLAVDDRANIARTPTAVCSCSQTIRSDSLYNFYAVTFTLERPKKLRKEVEDLGLRGLACRL